MLPDSLPQPLSDYDFDRTEITGSQDVDSRVETIFGTVGGITFLYHCQAGKVGDTERTGLAVGAHDGEPSVGYNHPEGSLLPDCVDTGA